MRHLSSRLYLFSGNYVIKVTSRPPYRYMFTVIAMQLADKMCWQSKCTIKFVKDWCEIHQKKIPSRHFVHSHSIHGYHKPSSANEDYHKLWLFQYSYNLKCTYMLSWSNWISFAYWKIEVREIPQKPEISCHSNALKRKKFPWNLHLLVIF